MEGGDFTVWEGDSGAREAVCNWTSPYLFENLARWTGLVDPERGVCRLDGPEAKELLEFAMEYGGKDSGKESGERIKAFGWGKNWGCREITAFPQYVL